MDDEDRRGRVQSVEHAALVLDALAAAAPATLAAVARGAGMPPAKAHRYLKSLVETGLAMQEAASGRYALGPAALRLGLAALGRLDVARAAAPALLALREETGATCLLVLPGGLVAAMEVAPGAVAVQSRLGAVLPPHSASARALAGEAAVRISGAVLPGVDALAAPLRDHAGRIVGALTAMGPTGTLRRAMDAVVIAAAAASMSLGYRRSSTET